MEALQTAGRIRKWAAIGMSVDKAEFGLRRLQKTGTLDATSKECLENGLGVFRLLKQGGEALDKGTVTEPRQLDAVALYEPLKYSQATIETAKISNLISLFDRLLESGVDIKDIPNTEIEEAFGLLLNFSTTYEQKALGELEEIERPEGQYVAHKGTA
jgi:hypothetical protein